MKKFIAAFDGLKFSESTKEYAVHLAKMAHAHLVGVFLEDITYTSYKIYDLVTSEGVSEARLKEYENSDKEKRANAVAAFEMACRDAGIEHSIHHDKKIALQELLHESVYADLLIIDTKETLTHYEEAVPSRFIKDLLSDVMCPVLLLPKQYNPINKIEYLYDGEPASVYAIRMFSYLFPLMEQLPAEIVSVKDADTSLHVPDSVLMKEFMKRHHPGALFTVLKGHPELEIVNHFKALRVEAVAVLGAYKRGTVSRWFRPSLANILMQELDIPLFIAHHK